jgi:hypothetical protein
METGQRDRAQLLVSTIRPLIGDDAISDGRLQRRVGLEEIDRILHPFNSLNCVAACEFPA